METIKRDLYLNRLIERRENGSIKVITGIRRCGKSYLLFKLYYQNLLDSGVEESRIIRILLDAFFISKAERYDIKGKRYIASPFKYYFTDVGLRNAQLNFRQ